MQKRKKPLNMGLLKILLAEYFFELSKQQYCFKFLSELKNLSPYLNKRQTSIRRRKMKAIIYLLS